jgi:NAD(P)-dependent dehydrogenase (short-subunit alcohol dehydrogenase family)
MRELEGKVAVVTGGASGIGRGLVERFLAEGMQVVLADVETDALESTMTELDRRESTFAVQTDVSDEGSVSALAEAAFDRFGEVHILCNNAGVSTFGRSWKFRTEDWAWVLGVNLWGVIHGVRAFVPRMIEQGEGHVVNTSSMVGVTTQSGLAPYSASKHAVVAFSEALDLELREVEPGVGVSVLCPGFVRTRIGESERNRPDGRAKSGIGDTVSGLLSAGISPAEAADLVVKAIRDEQFWIFTHPEMLEAVELRAGTMLRGERPAALDLAAMLQAQSSAG